MPVADYKLVAHGAWAPGDPGPRPCYSFCMCPGGQVVPTSTQDGLLCVNGMSFSKRASAWANSGLVVPVTPADYAPFADPGQAPLAGVAFQEAIERAAAAAGGGRLVAPAQSAAAFLAGVLDPPGSLPACSYRPGVRPARLDLIYPAAVTSALREGLLSFERRMRGYVSRGALLIGVETRTSAPLRLERGRGFESTSTEGLFPVGEGAGYAGGIVSAAVDGMSAARCIAAQVLND